MKIRSVRAFTVLSCSSTDHQLGIWNWTGYPAFSAFTGWESILFVLTPHAQVQKSLSRPIAFNKSAEVRDNRVTEALYDSHPTERRQERQAYCAKGWIVNFWLVWSKSCISCWCLAGASQSAEARDRGWRWPQAGTWVFSLRFTRLIAAVVLRLKSNEHCQHTSTMDGRNPPPAMCKAF